MPGTLRVRGCRCDDADAHSWNVRAPPPTDFRAGVLGAVLLAVALVACSKPHHDAIVRDPADAALPVVTWEMAIAAIAPARCDHAIRCGFIGRSERAECEKGPPPRGTITRVWEDPTIDGVDALRASGRATFDASRVATTADFWRNDECAYWSYRGNALRMLLRGTTELSGTCRVDEECASGACYVAHKCSGVCVAIPPARPRASAGASCDPVDCERGLACTPTRHRPEQPSVCVVRRPVGAACWFWGHCADGLTCGGLRSANTTAGYMVSAEGRCEPWRDVGSPCDPTAQSIANGCPHRTVCDPASRTCVLHSLAEQSTCVPGEHRCDAYRFCDAITRRCTRRLTAGAPCREREGGTSEYACAEGRCEDGTCVPYCP